MSKYITAVITETKPMTRGEFARYEDWLCINKEHECWKEEGYLVKYSDGYERWSPKDEFEKTCRRCDNMAFGLAIEALKKGEKVARRGWNGKGMFLYLKPAAEVKAEWCRDPELKKIAEGNGGSILALGTICMYTHDSSGRNAILTGWLASQSDMLYEDWYIIEEE